MISTSTFILVSRCLFGSPIYAHCLSVCRKWAWLLVSK